MMGVGKSTLGKIVAKKQDMEFIDTDVVIEEKCSMKISEIFEKKGEKFFRLEEKKEVMNSLKKNNSIIALGGGAFLDSAIRNYILGIIETYSGKINNWCWHLRWNKKNRHVR